MSVSLPSGPRVLRFRRGAGLRRSADAGRVSWVSMGHPPSVEARLPGKRTLAAYLPIEAQVGRLHGLAQILAPRHVTSGTAKGTKWHRTRTGHAGCLCAWRQGLALR